ncbi:hypothetical protein NA56DRAFT_602339 [Hyaloscypha hepaticicola]|uniref:G domain-containing protein n=1 Tax=Hyaloscypha hepaticicola TaxID=2082293 RepID=A0A2J6Q0V6_9HELO|nr:hypothetical protein NA56DRAFT_602339 [Hyaloscypha hepaticicola]
MVSYAEPHRKPRKIFIAVMGVTGSGKSTFIATATGSDAVGVGHDFKSYTAEVIPYTFVHGDYEITLIDTPGFNDTYRNESEVLMEIASWLEKTYRNPPHQKLTGIIYLQALTDRRIYGSTLRNLKMFRELCGDDPLRNVVFATTGWGTAARSGELEKAKVNEEQLRTDPDFWEPFVRRGSTVARFEDTVDSALAIVLSLADRAPTVLQIQQEMVDQDKDLVDTAAGHAVNEELRKLEEKYQSDLNALQEDMEHALAEKDLHLQSALAESKASIEKLRDEARHAQDMLQYERRNERRKYENDMQALQQRMARDLKKEKQEQELRHKAEMLQQNMKFDEIVKQLRENEHVLRREEREALESRIEEMERRHALDMQNTQSQGDSSWGIDLLSSLLPLVGSFAMGMLGFPGSSSSATFFLDSD